MRGQTTLQLVIPLVILLFILIGFATLIPTLTPTKTLALMGGLIIFIVSFVSTEIALYILIFSMLLSPEFIIGATRGATLGRGVTLRADDFILVLIGFSWLARMAINKELGLFLKTPLNKPIGYYIIICLVSTLLGAIFGKVDLKTGFFFVLKYFEYVIVYFMVANHLRSKTQVRYFLWALLLTCAIVSVIGIANIPGGGRVSAPFEGEAGEPNTFGGYLVFMVAVVAGLLMHSRSNQSRLVYIFLIGLFAVPLLYTQSRTSYLAAIPAILSLVWVAKRKYLILAILLLIGFALPLIAPQVVKHRVAYTFTQGKNRRDVVAVAGVKLDTSTSARLVTWREALKDWSDHPVLGYGVTGYRFVDAQYVRVLLESGILGLVLFFFLIATIFREARRIQKTAEDPMFKGISSGFLAGFIGVLFHAIGANTFIIVRIMEP
ncbi:MAG: O-antigen ligase family protein, partial [Proteobacteria bacterium]|nr:O-antigen ligase family protein [Pseudomonadota bacterium]